MRDVESVAIAGEHWLCHDLVLGEAVAGIAVVMCTLIFASELIFFHLAEDCSEASVAAFSAKSATLLTLLTFVFPDHLLY